MLYEESSKTLPVPELAALSFRRNIELAMAADLAGGAALAMVLPTRLHVPPAARPIVLGVPLGVILLSLIILYILRRSPPRAVVARFSQVIEARRRDGATVGALSRTFIALAAVLAFAFAYGVLMLIPVG